MGDRESSVQADQPTTEMLPARVKSPVVRVKEFRVLQQSHAISTMVKALGGSGNPWSPNLASFLKPGIPGAAGDTEELTQPYIQEAWIAAAVDFIGLVSALVRPRLWDRDPDLDGALEITDGPVIDLFKRPTPGLDWMTWRVEDALNINLFNESFHFLLDDSGNPVTPIGSSMDAPIDLPAEIVPVKGTAVSLEINRDNGRPLAWRVRGPKGEMLFQPGAVVIHGQTKDPARPYRYLGPTAKAWGAASMRYLANRYQGFLLRNAGDPGGIVSVDGNLAPGEVQRMQDEMANEWGDPERAGDWRLLWGGAKLERSKSSPKDLEWPMVHELTKEDISAVFGVSGSLLGKKDENFATFQGHWKMFVETRAIPGFRIDESQWNGFFRRLRQREFQNYHLRYDTEILDSLFATLEEKGENARRFYGMGVPLNESLRQAGVNTDPIEGGDIPMADQGILPLQAGIALGRATAASALQAAGVEGQEALEEVGLGHLTYVEPPEPELPDPGEVPRPSDSGNHDDEVQDRGLPAPEDPVEEVVEKAARSDGDGHDEWKRTQALQNVLRSKLDRSLKRVFRQMEVAQLAALQSVSDEGIVDRAAAFDFKKSLVKYREGDSVEASSVYPETDEPTWPDEKALCKALLEDLSEEASLIKQRSPLVVVKASCCGAEHLMPWRPRLRDLANNLDIPVPVQRLEDWHYLSKTDLTETQIELLILITDRKWVNALADRIEPATVEMFGLAVEDLASSWGQSSFIDVNDPQMLINMRAHAIDVAEGTQSVIAKRLRSDLIRVLSSDAGTFSNVRTAIESSLKQLRAEISSSFKSHQARALSIARTEIGRATESGRMAELEKLFADGIIRDIEWLTSLGKAVRPSHQAMHGQTRKPGTPFTSGDGVSLRHPLDPDAPAREVVNCFPADTLVIAPHTVRGMRREYDGPMASVVLRSGVRISCTPNHPLLTQRGWVGAGSLKHGDSLVRSSSARAIFGAAEDNVEKAPAPIEQVFLAEASRRLRLAKHVGGRADFHGDGQRGDIEIVGADWKLAEPALSEHLLQGKLAGSDVGLPLESPVGAIAYSDRQVGFSGHAHASTASGVSRAHPDRALVSKALRVAARPDGQAALAQAAAYGGPTHASLVRDALNRTPGGVEVDDVVDVDVYAFRGHVFNLSTAQGWYAVSTPGAYYYPTANCNCSLRGRL